MARPTEVKDRIATAVLLRARGLSYSEIASEMKCSISTAYGYIEKAYVDMVREPLEVVKQTELARLDVLLRKALDILERQHITVSNGRVMRTMSDRPLLGSDGEQRYDDDGMPMYEWDDIVDDVPALQAIKTVLSIMERRAKLMGLDAPTKTEVWTVDTIDAQIKRLQDEMSRSMETKGLQ